MERLTIRNSDGSVSQPTDLKWADAMERLAAYEDTGLEPENVLTALEMAHLFVELRKLEKVKKAESEGRLLILPCKVGDTVYCIRKNPFAKGRYVKEDIGVDCEGFVCEECGGIAFASDEFRRIDCYIRAAYPLKEANDG